MVDRKRSKRGDLGKGCESCGQRTLREAELVEVQGRVLKKKGVDGGTIGIEEDDCVFSTFRKQQLAFPKARFKRVDEIFKLVRMIKESEEIKLIKESVLIAEVGLKAGTKVAKVGVLESEIQMAAKIEKKRGVRLEKWRRWFNLESGPPTTGPSGQIGKR
jgi:Xaa-Pro aminopeptidase